jgi:hypothetical protein
MDAMDIVAKYGGGDRAAYNAAGAVSELVLAAIQYARKREAVSVYNGADPAEEYARLSEAVAVLERESLAHTMSTWAVLNRQAGP